MVKWSRPATAALLALIGNTSGAQIAPDLAWRTIRTQHFNVHFSAGLDEPARRAVLAAEGAYAQLAAELVAPRGPIELVVADNVDFANGFTTIYPTNRIFIYLHPPVQNVSLRAYGNWLDLVVAHELAHVFHLDRSRGWWRFAQRIFGRNPLLFPNVYVPAWVLEGLAVYYETRLTGSGRLEGSHHDVVARAAAVEGRFPRLGDLNPGSSRFPGGDLPYAYGSLLFEHLARTRGPQSVRAFVERSSAMPLPGFSGAAARRAFGVSFERAFREWRDSIIQNAPADRAPLPGWRQLTREGRYAFYPRWSGDTAVLFAANTGRETPGVYRVSLSGATERIGRVNSLDASASVNAGEDIFAQQEFVGPYELRSDLYSRQGSAERRLTVRERLSHPDVRGDGEIVTVQALPGTTRLARVARNGGRVRALTTSSPDTQWAEPRWSPDGTRIVAARLTRARSDIVVLDTLGHIVRMLAGGPAVHSAPAWSADGRAIYFTSDRTGAMQAFLVSADGGAITRLSDAATALLQIEPSPGGAALAGNHYRVDGHHIGVAPVPAGAALLDTLGRQRSDACTNCRAARAILDTALVARTLRVTRYSPWPSVLPRYWIPLAARTDGRTSIGALTSGNDVVGRHFYGASLFVDTRDSETDLGAVYRYAGLGQPLLDFSVEQDWGHSALVDTHGAVLGDLAERTRTYAVRTSFVRRRVRTVAAMSVGLEVEQRHYRTSPDTLLRQLSETFSRGADYPAVSASGTWTNAQRPGLAISAEDGIQLGGVVERRWRRGASGTTWMRAIGVTAAYKSLDLPGFAHHVIALRAAGGIADERATSLFSAGGVSGGFIVPLLGYPFGGRRTFAVRGYRDGAEQGTRAYAFTAEYRLPLAAPARRIRPLPLFVDRVSVSAFGEAGRAYCPAGSRSVVCGDIASDAPLMSSTGMELVIETPAQVQSPYNIRLGVARPLRHRARFRAPSVEWYLIFGHAF